MQGNFPTLPELISGSAVVSLTGLSKGAGKTAVLAYLVNENAKKLKSEASSGKKLALTAIGHGGSSPEVFVPVGTIVTTAESLVKRCDITKNILHTTGMNTPLGQVVVIEALSAGRAVLAGPTTNSSLSELYEYLKFCGAGQILVDGAADRKTFSAPSFADAIILCAGAAFDKSLDTVCDEIRHVCALASIPRFDGALKNSEKNNEKTVAFTKNNVDYIYISGAVTDAVFRRAVQGREARDTRVIAEDFAKIFVKRNTLERFAYKGGGLFVLNSVKLAAVAVNPSAPGEGYSFDAEEFLEKAREAASIPVYNVMENCDDYA